MLAERTSAEMLGGYSDPDAAAADMSLEEMMRIQRSLEEQILKLSGPTAQQSSSAPTAEQSSSRPKQSRGGRFTSSLQKLQSPGATPAHSLEATTPPIRIDVGQTYEVIFKRPVAVRTAPNLNAPFFRSLAPGSRVELFEWDATRSWRRITMNAIESRADQNNALEPDVDLPDYVQAALGPSTRRSVMETDENGGGKVLERDGWILIAHPQLGQLLQAVQLEDAVGTRMEKTRMDTREGRLYPDVEASTTALSATLPPSVQSTLEQLDFEAKAKAFDMAWGNTPFAPSTQNIAQKQQAPIRFANTTISKETQDEMRVLESVDEKPGLKEPTVMRATRAGNYEVVKSILGRGADANASDVLGETALMEASAAGRTDLVALLLLHGADPARAVPGGPEAALAMAADEPTKALLASWHGFRADERYLQAALHRLEEQDALRVSKRLGVELTSKLETADGLEKHASLSNGDGSDSVPQVESAQVIEIPASVGMRSSSSAPVVPGVRYKVVYKKVTVRQLPNKDSKSLGSKRLGDIVIMFEWDETRSWRRVKVDLTGAADTELQTDGWMLIHLPDVGPLLEEITDAPGSDSEDDDDEGAG